MSEQRDGAVYWKVWLEPELFWRVWMEPELLHCMVKAAIKSHVGVAIVGTCERVGIRSMCVYFTAARRQLVTGCKRDARDARALHIFLTNCLRENCLQTVCDKIMSV